MDRARCLDTLDALPLVAILRGLGADEAAAIGEALVHAGIRALEVPLSTPASLDALSRLVAAVGDRAVVGAGTVLTVAQVDAVAERGGRIVVSPNADVSVIAHTRARGLTSMPGVATPSEAFAALAAGADLLKLFPGEAIPPPDPARVAGGPPPADPAVPGRRRVHGEPRGVSGGGRRRVRAGDRAVPAR